MAMPKTDLQKRFFELCRSHDLIAVFAYGSRAAETAARLDGRDVTSVHPRSDLDLGVLPRRDVDFNVLRILEFMNAIESLLNVPRADIVDLRKAPPYLALDAIRGERLYCVDAYETDAFELFVLRRAADLAFFERERRTMLLTPANINRSVQDARNGS
jgi:hypothetical protein